MVQLGRIVHFSEKNLQTGQWARGCRVAIVTQVWNSLGMVNLYVFPDGINEKGGVETSIPAMNEGAKYDGAPQNFAKGWHWPH